MDWLRRFSVLAVFLGSVQLSLAQNQEIPDSLYYSSVGIDRNLDRARAYALNGLTQEIQVLISSSFENRSAETNAQLEQSTVSRVITRSITDLKDVREIMKITPEGLFRVVKYIPKSAVKQMFEIRRQRIQELIAIGERELQGEPVRLGAALKNFYWALLLSQLYPDTLSFSVRLDATTPLLYANVHSGISNIFDRILRELKFVPEKLIEDESIVWQYRMQVKNKPVDALHFEYYDGMGQTEADVKDGRTKLTFFFSKKDMREREVVVGIDYRSVEEMDELTRAADSLMSANALPSKITIVLPAGPIPPPPKEEKPPVEPPRPRPQQVLPAVLQEILAVGSNFNAVRIKLDSLARRNRIILGNANDFESLQGLYGLVLGPEGVLALLVVKDQKYLDARTGNEIDMKRYGGKRITWIEILK
ncbi:MAG: hypothetical protein NTU47_00240 [Ignavibacteriales bacterium]|nr:hypothetical protein [Ignavibacteriales bacterium]